MLPSRSRFGLIEKIFLAASLLVSAAVWITACVYRHLWNDEYLELWTDRAPTMRDILHIQANFPISLDPPAFHLLAHGSMRLFGENQIALRLPALLGVLFMEVALFELVRRTATARAGIIAATVPIVLISTHYAAEGRPYGLLFGLYACSLLFWYLGRASATPQRRTLAAVALAATLALAILSSFFGIFILIPVTIAEATQAYTERTLRRSSLLAILSGFASMALLFPFKHASQQYQLHYLQRGLRPSIIGHTYVTMFAGFLEPLTFYKPWKTRLVALGMASILLFAWRYTRRNPRVPAGLQAGLIALLLLPFAGYAFASVVTHNIEERHTQYAVIAVLVLLGYGLAPYLSRPLFASLMTSLLVAGSILGTRWIQTEKLNTFGMPIWLAPVPQVRAVLDANPGERIYTGNGYFYWFLASPDNDPALRSRITGVYDRSLDVAWRDSDTMGLTMQNARQFTGLSFLSYSELMRHPPRFLVQTVPNTDWLAQQMQKDGYTLHPLGRGLTGTVLEATPPPAPTRQPAP